jgi:hypothetical protein
MNFPQSWKYGPGLTFLPEASGNRRESRARLAAEANFGALLKWLARDEFANRYLWDHPEAIFTLQALQKENAQQQRTEAGA